jgi:hypothetical protein
MKWRSAAALAVGLMLTGCNNTAPSNNSAVPVSNTKPATPVASKTATDLGPAHLYRFSVVYTIEDEYGVCNLHTIANADADIHS